MNYAPFYAGQKVVCVDAMQGSRFKNGEYYIVSACEYKMCNGNYYWYVGIVGHENGGTHFRPSIFAPIQEKTFPLMTFREINKVEKIEELINN